MVNYISNLGPKCHHWFNIKEVIFFYNYEEVNSCVKMSEKTNTINIYLLGFSDNSIRDIYRACSIINCKATKKSIVIIVKDNNEEINMKKILNNNDYNNIMVQYMVYCNCNNTLHVNPISLHYREFLFDIFSENIFKDVKTYCYSKIKRKIDEV